jgi:hypothetical protein
LGIFERKIPKLPLISSFVALISSSMSAFQRSSLLQEITLESQGTSIDAHSGNEHEGVLSESDQSTRPRKVQKLEHNSDAIVSDEGYVPVNEISESARAFIESSWQAQRRNGQDFSNSAESQCVYLGYTITSADLQQPPRRYQQTPSRKAE